MDILRIVVIGDGGVGKTSLLNSFLYDKFDETYEPTIFDNYEKTILYKNREVHLILMDTAGQEDYACLRPLSYTNTNLFLLCFAFNDYITFNNIKSIWLPEIKKYAPNIPYLLIGTKLDLRTKIISNFNYYNYDNEEKNNNNNDINFNYYIENNLNNSMNIDVSFQNGIKLCQEINALRYLECSSITNQGINIVFTEAIRCYFKYYDENININQLKNNNKKKISLSRFSLKKKDINNNNEYHTIINSKGKRISAKTLSKLPIETNIKINKKNKNKKIRNNQIKLQKKCIIL